MADQPNDPYADTYSNLPDWSGVVPAGYTVNFAGALSRVDRLFPGAYLEKLKQESASERTVTRARPRGKEGGYYEMGAILEAVLCAREQFCMIELGAGVGPWTASAAQAISRLNPIPRYFVSVEAEPERYLWLNDNLHANGLAPDEFSAIHAAVFPSHRKHETVYFPSGAPLFAGHRVLPTTLDELPLERREKQIEYAGRRETAVMARVPTTSLTDILTKHSGRLFDIAHIDVQGLEYEVLEDSIVHVSSQIRALAIGTHGRDIEKKLHSLLDAAGWTCLISLNTQCVNRVGEIDVDLTNLDGFQHWVNPGLR